MINAFLRGTFARGLASLALVATAAVAQTNTDTGGTILGGVYDKSYATKAAVYCQITVTTTATALSSLLSTASCPAISAAATFAFVTPESPASGVVVRYRADGTAPTSAIGQPIQAYQSWPIQSALSLSAASLISATGASVTVDVEFRG